LLSKELSELTLPNENWLPNEVTGFSITCSVGGGARVYAVYETGAHKNKSLKSLEVGISRVAAK